MSRWFYGARSSAVQRASMMPAELCCAFHSPNDACAMRLSNREICIPVVYPNALSGDCEPDGHRTGASNCPSISGACDSV